MGVNIINKLLWLQLFPCQCLFISEEEFYFVVVHAMQLKNSGLFQAAVGKCTLVPQQSPQEQSCRDRFYSEVSSARNCNRFSVGS